MSVQTTARNQEREHLDAEKFSIKELMAVVFSRDLRDGERIFLGANVNIGRAGMLLAHLKHGPNMRLMLSQSWTSVFNEPKIGIYENSTDLRSMSWAEAYITLDTMINSYRYFSAVFVVSGLQVDKFGNTNLIGIGDDYKRLKVRGPGAIGSVSSTAFCERFYIMLNVHNRRTFVEKCDFISCVGFGKGGKYGRIEAGVMGEGPRYCITPLCVMDFDEETKRMRLKSVHRGVRVQDVVENTGFELIVPPHVPETEPPTGEELGILRNRVDTAGLLRTPF